MRILYFYQYFSSPKGSWGTRVYEYAKEWVEKGHKVTVVTSIYSKSDLTASKFIERQQVEGIDLIVLNIKIDNKQTPFKRIWTFIQYCFVASYFALIEKYDITIASSGPITVGIPGLVAKYIRQKKLVFEVRDLWPATAIEMGYIKSKVLKKIMFQFEKLCYSSAHLIVALSPGMKNNIIKRYKNFNIISVPNSANVELFSKKTTTKLPVPLKERNYAIYTGNIGTINNSKLLLEVAKLLKEEKMEFTILLVGDGPLKDELVLEAKKARLDNYFLVFDLMPKESLVPLVQSSLASLIPLADKPLLNTSSPNKLFESLAAGVPVIQTTYGWIKGLLKKNKCGFSVNPNKPEELVNVLKKLIQEKEIWKEYSTNSKNLAKDEFNKQVLANKMIFSMEDLL